MKLAVERVARDYGIQCPGARITDWPDVSVTKAGAVPAQLQDQPGSPSAHNESLRVGSHH